MPLKKEIKIKKPVHKPAAKAAHPPVHKPAHAAHAESHAPKISGRYFEGIGRRKTAVARVRVTRGAGKLVVNDRPLEKYFQAGRLRQVAEEPLKRLGVGGEVDISVKMSGGGINAQAEAVRHGISRALALMKPDMKLQLAALGLLTRDPRMVERKKPGLKKARRAPQWKKR